MNELLSESDIVSVTSSVLQTLFNLEALSSTDASAPPEFELTGVIQIVGDWKGAVLMDCSAEFAHAAAASFFKMSPSEVTSEDVQDAAAELVNTLAGNIKPLLPGPSFLTLPTVTFGKDYRIAVPNTHCESSTLMQTENGTLRLSIWRFE